MQRKEEWKLVLFDGRLESYFSDGSIMFWQKGCLVYYSTKGNKIRIGIQTLKLSEDCLFKLNKIAQTLSIYQDEYYIPSSINPQQNPTQKENNYFKKYKISQFFWENAVVQQNQQGFITKSDDGVATVILRKNLYQISIVFPQRTGRRKTSSQGQFLVTKNRRRELIEKYGGQYVQYPDNMVQVDIQYQYVLISKSFTMFNLPKRWSPPMKIIWGYLLSNQIIKHSFCYIDFQDPDNRELAQIKTTKMPPVIPILAQYNLQHYLQEQAIPLYGKPNHAYKWKWLYVQRQNYELYSSFIEGGSCIFCQNYGFWFIQDSTAIFRTTNKAEVDYKVLLSAFPFTVRLQSQPSRDIRTHILASTAYIDHRLYLSNRKVQQPNGNVQTDQLICEEQIPQIGVFKAYGNGVVIARFEDKTLMTIRSQQIKITAPNGRSLLASLSGSQPKEFKDHLGWLIDWYEKTYFPNQWNSRQAMNEVIEQRLHATQTFLKVARHYQKRG